jgi:hypothetical protein
VDDPLLLVAAMAQLTEQLGFDTPRRPDSNTHTDSPAG